MSGTVDSNLLGDGPYRIGHLTLNAPQSLNSLTRDMVEILLTVCLPGVMTRPSQQSS